MRCKRAPSVSRSLCTSEIDAPFSGVRDIHLNVDLVGHSSHNLTAASTCSIQIKVLRRSRSSRATKYCRFFPDKDDMQGAARRCKIIRRSPSSCRCALRLFVPFSQTTDQGRLGSAEHAPMCGGRRAALPKPCSPLRCAAWRYRAQRTHCLIKK